VRSLIWFWLVVSAAIGCGNDLPAGSHISKLRLIALRAEPAFPRPGDTVELQLLAADSDQRTLQFASGTCTNPVSSTVEHCIDGLDAPLEPLVLTEGRFSVDIPDQVLSGLSPDARPSALVGVVVVACPGEIEAGSTSGVPVVCRDAGGARLPLSEFEVGVKRLFVREHDENENPVIRRVTWDGDAWPETEEREARACGNAETDDIEDCEARLRHRLRVEVSAPERGVDESGVHFEENVIVSYYATHGVFERPVRIAAASENTWAAQRNGDGNLATVWFVARDDRGGAAWTFRRVRIR
jgi:hypothetical protein